MDYNGYETALLKTIRLTLKKGEYDDYVRVYEYDFNKLSGIDERPFFEKLDNTKIKSWFKGGAKKYYKKLVKAHMFDWIMYFNNFPVGNVYTGEEDLKQNTIELFVNIHPNHWGNGYAAEAVVIVLDYLFKIGYEGVVFKYLDGNLNAKRVAQKLGFKPYEIKRDAYHTSGGVEIDEYVLIMKKDDFLSRTQKITKIKDSL